MSAQNVSLEDLIWDANGIADVQQTQHPKDESAEQTMTAHPPCIAKRANASLLVDIPQFAKEMKDVWLPITKQPANARTSWLSMFWVN